MDTNLKASLKNLHANLASTGPVDEELRDLLQQLDGDIKQLLEERADPEQGESTTFGLAERTQEISAKFAAQHPQLEPALRELGNILSSMGI
jgi:arsenate reductase-like glutaredoxin family protein